MEKKHQLWQLKNLEQFLACLQCQQLVSKKLEILLDHRNFFNFTYIKIQGLTDDLIERCERAGFDAICLTVDTVVAGNRERDRRTGFTTPPRLTLSSLISFITHPVWGFNYLIHKKFQLANIIHMTEKGSSIDKSVY